MDLYHSWIYVYVLNTPWFVWGFVGLIIAINALLPVIVWFLFSGRKVRFLKKMAKGSMK